MGKSGRYFATAGSDYLAHLGYAEQKPEHAVQMLAGDRGSLADPNNEIGWRKMSALAAASCR